MLDFTVLLYEKSRVFNTPLFVTVFSEGVNTVLVRGCQWEGYLVVVYFAPVVPAWIRRIQEEDNKVNKKKRNTTKKNIRWQIFS